MLGAAFSRLLPSIVWSIRERITLVFALFDVRKYLGHVSTIGNPKIALFI